MKIRNWTLLALVALGLAALPVRADVWSQCPEDTDPTDTDGNGDPFDDHVCLHLAAGDGIAAMADGTPLYTFGFSDVTGLPDADVMMAGMLAAELPAPTIVVPQGKKLYLNLTNVGMMLRPDLFDPHSVHWHGKINVPVFDGLPEASMVINMGSTFTYFYVASEEGTFFYHCHVEASEHMQMGMIGNLWVTPRQDGTAYEYPPGSGRVYTHFAYNDGDGSTGYDVAYPLQLTAFDPNFHTLHLGVQPLPFANMEDRYFMFNGRGYPDTVDPNAIPNNADQFDLEPRYSQKVSALIEAQVGQRILLRMSSVVTTEFCTVSVLGLPMRVVGQGARIRRGPAGTDISYETASVTLGGGESADVIVDTAGAAPGTYFVYATNLQHLNNDAEEYGGLITEIRLTAAAAAPTPGVAGAPPARAGARTEVPIVGDPTRPARD